MDNMTYADNINQSKINEMIGLKNMADFEIATVDIFNTHESEKNSNYTSMYEETTEIHVETASECYFKIFESIKSLSSI